MTGLPNRSTITSLALVVLLVTSGFSGTAVAAEAGECSDLDDFVMFLTLGAVNGDECTRQAYVEDAIQEMKASDQNQTKVDIYSAADGVQNGHQTYIAPFDNYLNDSESVAWMKMQAAVARAYKNGSSEIQATAAAEDAIADYYAKKQVNLNAQFEQSMGELVYLTDVVVQENISADPDGYSGDYNGYIRVYSRHPDGSQYYGDYDSGLTGTTNSTVTLVNGTTMNVTAFTFDGWGSGSFRVDKGKIGGGSNPTWSEIRVKPPGTGGYEMIVALDTKDYKARWDAINTKSNNLQVESRNFVNATYESFESGDINASDVITSNTAMFEYGVRGANETDGLWRSTAGLAMAGFSMPNLNQSGTMTVGYQNQEYTGLVMARNVPNNTWTVGQTYNTSNFSGPVFMLTTGGEKIDFADGETFRINGMTAKDGTQLSSVGTTNYAYKTANTSQFLAMQEELSLLRQEIEEREPDGGGTSDGSSSGTSNTQLLVGAAALVAVALIAKDQAGGDRRE